MNTMDITTTTIPSDEDKTTTQEGFRIGYNRDKTVPIGKTKTKTKLRCRFLST